MNFLPKLALSAALLAIILIAGCAGYVSPEGRFYSPWHGRMSLKVSPEQGSAPHFSAEFELSGNEQTGELTLYNPFGSTAAALKWTPQSATLHTNGETKHFESLNALLRETIGTELPVAALFAWVAGEPKLINGWHADLTDYPQGRIKARRQDLGSAAELNLVLTK